MTWTVIRDRYKLYDITPADKQARFYGIPKELGAYWKERIKDGIMNRTRFSVFDLSDKAMAGFLERFKTIQFGYIYGYTSALVLFARYLIHTNIVLKDVCPTLKICISTSEVCTLEDHQLLQKGFGVKHVREYGASETCMMAFDIAGQGWSITEETIFLETLERESSYEPDGALLCTSLFNKAFPMVRYQIGDSGIIDPAASADIHRNLRTLTGRTNDTILLPDGRKAAGLTFYYISRSILESGGVLKEFIIRQISIDHFVFEVVAERDITTEEIKQIQDRTVAYLGVDVQITISRVQQIQRPASGKVKHFYSELKV